MGSHFHGQIHFHRQMCLQSSLHASGPDRKSLLMLHTHPCALEESYLNTPPQATHSPSLLVLCVLQETSR